MGRSSRNRKILAKLGPSPAELEHERLINFYENESNHHPLLCIPTNLPEFYVVDSDMDGPYKILKIPAWTRFDSPNNGRYSWNNFKGDAYSHMVWNIQECEKVAKILNLYRNNESDYSNYLEYNITAWELGKEKALHLFLKGGKFCRENEQYHPAYNNKICKHFIQECIQRVLETIHISHEQKIAAAGLMFAAWFQPKES